MAYTTNYARKRICALNNTTDGDSLICRAE